MKAFALPALLLLVATLFVVMSRPATVYSVEPHSYAGSQACAGCHAETDLSTSGFNIWEEFHRTGHPYAAATPIPTFPEGTNDVPLSPPPATPTWDPYAFVLGGYGWKATYVGASGLQYTEGAAAQFNLETGSWSPYHPGETLKFDHECARCHTTGADPLGSWNGVAEDSLGDFHELGVQCEGCHGPSRLHVERAFSTPEGEIRVLQERCGDCHNNGGKHSRIPVVDGFLVNHAQYQEMEASRHGMLNFFTCATCHESHVALTYPELAGARFSGIALKAIRQECQDCHPDFQTNHPAPTTCTDCHMAPASKSAVGLVFENGGARGDVATHLWRIDTRPVPRDSMFTPDGDSLRAGAGSRAAVTLDFACLGCHTDADETLAWASTYASSIHQVAATQTEQDRPTADGFRLLEAYPNPFRSRAHIRFRLDRQAHVTLQLYSLTGRALATLVDETRSPGIHTATWQADDALASGVVVVRLSVGERRQSGTLLRVR